jgi:hypothetical protein
VEFCTIIRIGGGRYFADNAIGSLWVTEIEQPARQYATLSPPFIGFLETQIIA